MRRSIASDSSNWIHLIVDCKLQVASCNFVLQVASPYSALLVQVLALVLALEQELELDFTSLFNRHHSNYDVDLYIQRELLSTTESLSRITPTRPICRQQN